MAANATASKFHDQILQAAAGAQNNPYVRRMIEDDELRDNAIAGLRSARKAYERGSQKNWSKSLASDRKMKRDLKAAIEGMRDTRESLIKPKKRKHRLRRLILIAAVAGIAALALSPDARSKLLDGLFGGEEEFNYTSTTTSANGSA